MTHSARPFRKYVVSAALVTSIAFTPLVGTSVSAQANAPSSNTNVQIESNLLTQGDRGQAVSSLQSELSQQGYYTYNVDGIYGPITTDAVRNFQADHGLAVDGVAGPRTKAALGTDTTSQASNETETVTLGASSSSAGNNEIVAAAENLIGIPYEFGGTTRSGLDSSGFINETFEQVGVDVSRTHAGMWVNNGTHVSSPSVGDVVFFEGTYDTEGPSHSGIYIGGNQMIHAGSGGVEVSNMGLDYWQNHYIGAKSIQ